MWGKLTSICHNLSFGRLQSHFLWATDLWRPMATANDRQLDDAVEIDSRPRGMLQLRLEILQGKKRTYTLYIFIYTYTHIYIYVYFSTYLLSEFPLLTALPSVRGPRRSHQLRARRWANLGPAGSAMLPGFPARKPRVYEQ